MQMAIDLHFTASNNFHSSGSAEKSVSPRYKRLGRLSFQVITLGIMPSNLSWHNCLTRSPRSDSRRASCEAANEHWRIAKNVRTVIADNEGRAVNVNASAGIAFRQRWMFQFSISPPRGPDKVFSTDTCKLLLHLSLISFWVRWERSDSWCSNYVSWKIIAEAKCAGDYESDVSKKFGKFYFIDWIACKCAKSRKTETQILEEMYDLHGVSYFYKYRYWMINDFSLNDGGMKN